ncbi:MAG TPA: hypothetical protein VKG92_05630, partial [Flavobacteriales bacterium]|nr:hypothetical protein [Flavobacteriales bacterium]
GDSGSTSIERQAIARCTNGDILVSTAIGDWPGYERTRFVRCTAYGAPLQAWDITGSVEGQVRQIIPLSDGTFACFGKRSSWALYMRLAADGTLLVAKGYRVGNSSCDWFQAVQADENSFEVVGAGGFVNTGMRGRIALDGTLLSGNTLTVGSGISFLNSVVKRAAGGYVAACGSNAIDTGLVKVIAWDDAGNVQWSTTLADTIRTHTYAKVFELSDGTLRLVTRYQQPGKHGLSMAALDADGDLLWMRRRVASGPHSELTNVAPNAVLLDDDHIMVYGREGNTDDEFIHIVDTEANEVNLGFLGPTTAWGQLLNAMPAGSGYVDLIGAGPGPFSLPSGRLSMSVIHTNADLDLCGVNYESTALVDWIPFLSSTWAPGSGSIAVTDLLADLVRTPATAYVSPICNAMAVDDAEALLQVGVSPNPSTACFLLQGVAMDQVLVFDALGRTVMRTSLNGQRTAIIDLGDRPDGSYHAIVLHGRRWESLNLVKQRTD